jgi:two-component system, OmpR family, response regulator QseB
MFFNAPSKSALLHPVLLVEDDLDLGAELQRALQSHGIRCVWVRRMQDADDHLRGDVDQELSCVVLDLGLPDGDGIELLRRWRRAGQSIPVIVLSARDAVSVRIDGLDSGADDYVVKPVMPQELVSRIRAVVRRRAGQDQSIWVMGALRINPGSQEVWLDATSIAVSPKEFALLCELARHAGSVVTKHKLARVIDPLGDLPDFNALEVHIHNLRRKVGSETIRTVRGVGYLVGK